jgi:uncharacterized protein (TIGR00255 family)
MTGFARAHLDAADFSLALTVKSVNHRSLDVQMRLPAELEAFEVEARNAVKKKLARGSVQVNASLEMRGAAPLKIKRPIAEAYLAAYKELARDYGIIAEPDLSALFRLPGILSFGETGGDRSAEMQKALLETLDRALDELSRVRECEATAIVEEMERRCEAIGSGIERIEQLRDGLTGRLADRMQQKLSEMLKTVGIDPQRLLQEAAFLADRSDISEEVQRLRAHNEQLRALLGSPGDIGKKIDFLLQEMNREANTILSKTSGIGDTGLSITDIGLALKAEIEKIREQGMNLE